MEIRKALAYRCAKYSVKHWNANRPSRTILRYAFWWLAEKDVRFLTKWSRTGIYMVSGLARRGQHVVQGLEPVFDLYAETFYGDRRIMKLVVDDDARVCDPSKMVVGYSPSYCALMARLALGYWLKGQPCDAKYWVDYLARNGFTNVSKEAPVHQITNCKRGFSSYKIDAYYIGVLPDVGEHGLVVWTNGLRAEETPYNKYTEGFECEDAVLCSTYLGGKFEQMFLPNLKHSDVTWVRIV